jgi:hypothetical protein
VLKPDQVEFRNAETVAMIYLWQNSGLTSVLRLKKIWHLSQNFAIKQTKNNWQNIKGKPKPKGHIGYKKISINGEQSSGIMRIKYNWWKIEYKDLVVKGNGYES